jgi:primosomal replication protein N
MKEKMQRTPVHAAKSDAEKYEVQADCPRSTNASATKNKMPAYAITQHACNIRHCRVIGLEHSNAMPSNGFTLACVCECSWVVTGNRTREYDPGIGHGSGMSEKYFIETIT